MFPFLALPLWPQPRRRVFELVMDGQKLGIMPVSA